MYINFESPISLKKIAESGQCFRWTPLSENQFQIIANNDLLIGEQITDSKVWFSSTQKEFSDFWENYFDLGTNYNLINDKIILSRDPLLIQALEYGKGIRILNQDPWETTLSFIISQQKNIPAIQKTIEILSNQYGNPIDKDHYTFPKANDINKNPDLLSQARLGFREKYIRSLVDHIVKEPTYFKDLENHNDQKLLKHLTSLYGVGPKIANCVMLFSYHRLNAFPVDVWIKRILDNHYQNGFKFFNFCPYNGVIQQYLFYYFRNNNIKE